MLFHRVLIRLILCLIIILPGAIRAQPGNFSVRSYTERDGLSDNSVTGILRDSKGFVWITTSFGINRFDGERFTLFAYPHNGMDYLLRNNYTGVTEITPGVLLFTAYSGEVYIYSYSSGKLKLLSSVYSLFNNLSIRNICKTDRNELAFCTGSGFIVTDLNFAKLFEVNLAEMHGFDKNLSSVNQVVKDKSGNYWLGCYNLGLLIYERKHGKLSWGTDGVNPVNMQINDMCFSSDSLSLWIAASALGLIRTNIANRTSELIEKDKFGKNFPFGRFSSLAVSGDTMLFSGSRNGLLAWYPLKREFTVYGNIHTESNSPSEVIINTIYKDPDDIFWIGTTGGISVINIRQPLFRKIASGKDGTDAEVTGFYLENNTLLISTAHGLIKRDLSSNQEEYIDFRILTGNANAETLFPPVLDKNGNYWFGSWGGGVIRVSKNDLLKGTFRSGVKNFTAKLITGPENDFCRKIISDNSGNLWFATWGSGLLKVNAVDLDSDFPEFINYKKRDNAEEGGINTNFLMDIHYDKSGKIWIASSKGLQYFEPEKNKFSTIDVWKPENNSYINNPLTIHESPDGEFWCGTYTGLLKVYKTVHGKYAVEKYFLIGSRSEYINRFQIYPEISGLAAETLAYTGLIIKPGNSQEQTCIYHHADLIFHLPLRYQMKPEIFTLPGTPAC